MYGRAATFLANRLSLKGEAAQEETFSELVSRLRVLREKSSTAGGETLKTIAVDESTGNPAATLQLEKRTGCWICGAVLDAIFGFLSKYQYELTINPDTQREHADREDSARSIPGNMRTSRLHTGCARHTGTRASQENSSDSPR